MNSGHQEQLDPLAGIPMFAELTAEERGELVQLFKPRKFSPGQHIVWVGEPGKEFFLINRGTVNITLPDDAGRELVLATLGAGHFFGEISLLDGGPRTATARAQTESVLMELGRDDFLDFIQSHPPVAIHMMTVLGKRLRENNEKLRGFKNANEIIAAKKTSGQRLIERVTVMFSSTRWVVANLLFFTVWILINLLLIRSGRRPFDEPPTFFTLGFYITLEAILLSMFVLNSQRRQADSDRIRADLEYEVNVKAHLEVMQLHQKIDRLESMVVGDKRH